MAIEDERCCSGMHCAFSFLAGAVVGGRTRRQLKRMAEDAKEKTEDCYDEIKDRAAEMIQKV